MFLEKEVGSLAKPSPRRRTRRSSAFARQVFINCPFDAAYYSLLRPLLFTIIYFGYSPRIASERSDSLENRLAKICRLIRGARYSIHDLSRLRAGAVDELQRMNMPFELGLDYGARTFGIRKFRGKKCLILEKGRHELGKALSDLGGVDIKSHGNNPIRVVAAVRDWLIETVRIDTAESATRVWFAFTDFTNMFRKERLASGFTEGDLDEMSVAEYMRYIEKWVAARDNPAAMRPDAVTVATGTSAAVRAR